MRKLAPILVTIFLIAIMAVLVMSRAKQQGYVTVLTGNTDQQPVAFEPGRYQDTQCGMLLEQIADTAQAVSPNGKTWFFDDVGCLALWLDKVHQAQDFTLWVYTRDTNDWLDARAAWFSRSDETPMHFGFAAYADSAAGFVDFTRMSALMLRGDNLTNPYTRKELLGNH